MKRKTIHLAPDLGVHRHAYKAFCLQLRDAACAKDAAEFERLMWDRRKSLLQNTSSPQSLDDLKLMFAQNITLDLVGLGAELSLEKGEVLLNKPDLIGISPDEQKQLVRKSQLMERNAQLRDLAVVDFVKGMERRRLTGKGWHSIFSLMRDGHDLSSALSAVSRIENQEERANELRKIIRPYLQFVEDLIRLVTRW